MHCTDTTESVVTGAWSGTVAGCGSGRGGRTAAGAAVGISAGAKTCKVAGCGCGDKAAAGTTTGIMTSCESGGGGVAAPEVCTVSRGARAGNASDGPGVWLVVTPKHV